MITTEIYTAPAHWATALIYGDYSNIDCEREEQRIQAFESSLPGHVSDAVDIGFTNPIITDTPIELAGDFAEYTVIVQED